MAGIDGNNLRLVMATAPLVKMLGEPRNADVVTAALGELLPGQWTMRVEVGTDVTAAPALPVAAPPPAPAEPATAGACLAGPPTPEPSHGRSLPRRQRLVPDRRPASARPASTQPGAAPGRRRAGPLTPHHEPAAVSASAGQCGSDRPGADQVETDRADIG